MSKKNNITTDHFKVGGSGHSGENILHELNKQQYSPAQKAEDENSLIPGQDDQHDETPAPRGNKNRAGNATPSSNSSSGDY
jgi:hypothetical protein